jgi:tripartite-type tricarboxylate transporter receptor subunit TctC
MTHRTRRSCAKRILPLRRRGFAGLLAIAGAALFATVAPVAQAADIPAQVKLVVPFAPGASNDLFARALAARLGPRIGATLTVENRPGAGGMIGAEQVMRAAPDGATLLFSSSAITSNAAVQAKMPYDPLADVAPVALVATSGLMMVVPAGSPHRSFDDLLKAIRASKGQMTYASSGVGSINHVSTELMHSMAGTAGVHVPYKGISQVMVDMVAGRVDYLLTTVASSRAQVDGGKLRPLAVSSPARSPFKPDLPPIADWVPGFAAEVWWGVFAPSRVPEPVITRLNAEIRAVIADPEMKALFAKEGAVAGTLDVPAFVRKYRSEIGVWQKLVQDRKIARK